MAALKIDEASYQEGRAAFAAGASLRSIVEQCAKVKPADEAKVFSGAIGFFDGLLDLLRSKKVKK